ncbi:MAG: DNA-binding protein [Gammaproteobacteria bacterium]|nr:MAG: DNA-binding protein [Gammaproteobacteria bacterium]
MTNLTILTKEIRLHDGLHSLNDLHKAAGNARKHTPSRFIRNEQTQELINEIGQDPDLGLGVNTIHGGINRGTYVCKELVYAYAMWISPKFHLAVIRAFDQMCLTQQMQSYPHLLAQTPQLDKKDLYHLITVPGMLSLEDLALLSKLINDRYLDTIKAHQKVLGFFTANNQG